MTTLPVTLGDQTLIAMEKVKIASGDIESVFLKVEFDENWADFTARSASFYTSHDATAQEIMLIDNQCTIPADLLAQPGTLYIGIVGATTDGSAVKTSSVTGFRIVQGANHAYTTIKPKMDMYQQFLAAVKEEHSPLLDAMRTEMNGKYADFTSHITEALETIEEKMLDTLNGEVVWTNPNPKAAHEGESYGMDLSSYQTFIIECTSLFTVDDTNTVFNFVHHPSFRVSRKDDFIDLADYVYDPGESDSSCYCVSRKVMIQDKKIIFHPGYKNRREHNFMMVPVRVIGYRH